MRARVFAVLAGTGTTASRILDPATSGVHRSPQPLPTGRAVMDFSQVAAWPEDPTSPVLVVRASPAQLTDNLLASLSAAGVEAVSIRAAFLDQDLVAAARRIATGSSLMVSVTVSQAGLARIADDLARYVHAVRVRLHGPTEESHNRRMPAGQASYQQALSGIRAGVDAGLPVQLLMTEPPRAPGGAAKQFIADTTVRALQLRACGVTLLPAPVPHGLGRPASSLLRVVPGGSRMRRLLTDALLPEQLPVRIGTGRAEEPLTSGKVCDLLRAATTASGEEPVSAPDQGGAPLLWGPDAPFAAMPVAPSDATGGRGAA